jgi:hypothetical protein
MGLEARALVFARLSLDLTHQASHSDSQVIGINSKHCGSARDVHAKQCGLDQHPLFTSEGERAHRTSLVFPVSDQEPKHVSI